ncbi:fusaric acid resistance family protein [Pontibacter ummariensis]|uniref:Fusaric acid resistance protein-like n=1 Tax=Pontibacter ummariensis TaxID=1610492 RepID=A0A239D1J9_9BACT|nr:FUSC family protein [Pontibacter ummariensis]PRY14200.1 fusaric acid resistance family protein [Pontibacter ummariensis]SNS26305.1 Fusaric acid resistance protein-like [Pontibacter ummariensis]
MKNIPTESRQVVISNTQNALFSAVVVVLALWLSNYYRLASLTGFLVVAMLSVTGVNLKETFRARMTTAAQAALVLTGTVALAVVVKDSLLLSAFGVVVLAFSLGYWRRAFPMNWPDINIPAGVLFFMALAEPEVAAPIGTTALGGGVALVFQAVLSIAFRQRTRQGESSGEEQPKAAAPEGKPGNVFYLGPDLLIYCIELSILLVIGLLVYRLTGYAHGYWMPFTAIVVLQVSHTHTKKRIGERMIGTLIGCVIGSGLLLLHVNVLILTALIALNVFLFLYFVRKNYAVAVTFITIFVLLLLGSISREPLQIALERIAFTLAGGALTFMSSFAF